MMSSDSKGKNVKSLLGYFMINTKQDKDRTIYVVFIV